MGDLSMDILFLSSGDSARGPMAVALMARALGPAYRIRSVGQRPRPLHPVAVRAMAEAGLDIASHSASTLRTIDTLDVELCINLCFGEQGPVIAGRMRRLDWPTPDPTVGAPGEEALLIRMRQTRAQLERRAEKLALDLKAVAA
jgi:arsenate reductase